MRFYSIDKLYCIAKLSGGAMGAFLGLGQTEDEAWANAMAAQDGVTDPKSADGVAWRIKHEAFGYKATPAKLELLP